MEDGGAIICSVDDAVGDALNDLRGETTPKGLMRRSVGEKSKADVSWRHDRARITMDVMVEFILREFWLWRGVVSLSKIRCTRYDILWTVDLLICRSLVQHWCEWSLGLFHCILMTSCSCFVRLSVTGSPLLGRVCNPERRFWVLYLLDWKQVLCHSVQSDASWKQDFVRSPHGAAPRLFRFTCMDPLLQNKSCLIRFWGWRSRFARRQMAVLLK